MNPYPANPILIVEDEAETLRSFSMALRMSGINHILTCADSREAEAVLSQHPVGVALLDMVMPHLSGEELLQRIKQEYPWIPVIIITGVDEVDTAVRCIKAGALDYMVKPVEKDRLVSGVQRAIEIRELQEQNSLLKERMLTGKLAHPEVFADIITADRSMLAVFQYVESIAVSRQPVLITGETGTGKELLSGCIHRLSRPDKPLTAVNVAGIDDHAFTDTLFGHAKGAFTGAAERRPGLVEKAAGGTLFLDEIGDLGPESQVKLLRLLQEREYFPLGCDTAKTTDVRVIATTNQDLEALQQSGRFRKDLFYRLSTHRLHLPALRQRRADIPLLLDHFLAKAAAGLGKEVPLCPQAIVTALSQHDFPGNVRELAAMVHDAVGRDRIGRLSAQCFPGLTIAKDKIAAGAASELNGGPPVVFPGEKPLPTIKEATLHLIQTALKHHHNNQSAAAQALGISRQRLARYLKHK